MDSANRGALAETRYSVPEAKRILSMSERWTREQVRKRLLKSERYGRVWRITGSDLRRFIEERRSDDQEPSAGC